MARLLESLTSHCEIHNQVGNHSNQPRRRYNFRSILQRGARGQCVLSLTISVTIHYLNPCMDAWTRFTVGPMTGQASQGCGKGC